MELCHKHDISVPHVPLTIESHPIDIHSDLIQVLTKLISIGKWACVCGNNNWNRNVYFALFCRMEDILAFPHGPFTKECDLAYSHSGLNKGASQTNKQRHFKEIRGWICGNDNGNIKRPYKLLCFAIRKSYWLLMSPSDWRMTLLNHILV